MRNLLDDINQDIKKLIKIGRSTPNIEWGDIKFDMLYFLFRVIVELELKKILVNISQEDSLGEDYNLDLCLVLDNFGYNISVAKDYAWEIVEGSGTIKSPIKDNLVTFLREIILPLEAEGIINGYPERPSDSLWGFGKCHFINGEEGMIKMIKYYDEYYMQLMSGISPCYTV